MALRRGLAYMEEERTKTTECLSLNGHALLWYRINDVVMGGHSQSTISKTADGALTFSGNISLVDGGFATASTVDQPLGGAGITGLQISATTDGQLYQLMLKTSSSVWEPTWQANFPAASLVAGERATFDLPLSSFRASRMGKPVPHASLDPSRILSIGVSLALVDAAGAPNPHLHAGPFRLLLHSVAAITEAAAGAEEEAAAGADAAAATAAKAKAATAAEEAAPAEEEAPAAAAAPPTKVVLAAFDGSAPARAWRVTDDPVMGGASHSALRLTGQGSASFEGTCAIVRFLHAPGFCKVSTGEGYGRAPETFPDASPFLSGGLHLTVRSATPAYRGFKASFTARGMVRQPGQFHGVPSFKADFAVPAPSDDGPGWVTVRVPFSSFSAGTSEYTGRCDTKDPTGLQHHCCGTAHPELCPTAAHLSAITGLALWAEGVEGDFSLEVRAIAAGL